VSPESRLCLDHGLTGSSGCQFTKPAVSTQNPLAGVIECNRDTGNELPFHSRYRPDLVVPPLGTFGVHDQDKDDDPFADEGEVPFPLLCL